MREFLKGDRVFSITQGLGTIHSVTRGDYSIIVNFDSGHEGLFNQKGYSHKSDMFRSLYHANIGIVRIDTTDNKIPIDTLVWVNGEPFHFAGFDRDNVLVFKDGRTSKTSKGLSSYRNYSFDKNYYNGGFEKR